VITDLADNALAYGVYVAAWAFFAYGPQLLICLLFAWSACRRTRGDLLDWLVRGFLWSLLPYVGVIAMWLVWRRAARGDSGAPAAT
jgi:hypothetical protein